MPELAKYSYFEVTKVNLQGTIRRERTHLSFYFTGIFRCQVEELMDNEDDGFYTVERIKLPLSARNDAFVKDCLSTDLTLLSRLAAPNAPVGPFTAQYTLPKRYAHQGKNTEDRVRETLLGEQVIRIPRWSGRTSGQSLIMPPSREIYRILWKKIIVMLKAIDCQEADHSALRKSRRAFEPAGEYTRRKY